MEIISLVASIKAGISAGKAISSLSKDIGKFFDATDTAKKQLQKKGVSGKSVNSTALDRWANKNKIDEAFKAITDKIS